MKIILGIFIVLLIYYIILFRFVFRRNKLRIFFFRRKPEDKMDIINPQVLSEIDIVGKSKTIFIEPKDEPVLDIEVDIEYTEDLPEEELDEETILLEETGLSELSSGVSYEDLQLVVDVVQQEDVSEEKAMEAGEIIANLGQTDMFELMIQFSGGVTRVNDLLKKHVDKISDI